MLLGDAMGGFGMANDLDVGSSPNSVTSAGFNRDGNMDLATASIDSNDRSVLFGTGSGSFRTTNPPLAVGQNPFSVISPAGGLLVRESLRNGLIG